METDIYTEWRNQHESQEFPFIGSSGYFPNNLFVDISIASYGSQSIWLSSLSQSGSVINGILKSDSGEVFSFSQTSFNSCNAAAPITSSRGKQVGTIVFGESAPSMVPFITSSSSSIKDGTILVDPLCIFVFSPKQVSSIQIGRDVYSGVIKLVEGEGVTITGTGSNVVVNSIGGDNSPDCCLKTFQPLKSINSITTKNGNLFIRAQDVGQPASSTDVQQIIRINPIPNGIQISLSN